MTEKRYFAEKHFLRNDEIHDIVCHQFLNTDETVELLNRLEKDRQLLKELKTEYKRINLLNDENQKLKKENKELQERNKRQAETIRGLCNLIGITD